MKIRELIEELKQYDPELLLFVRVQGSTSLKVREPLFVRYLTGAVHNTEGKYDLPEPVIILEVCL